MSRIFQPGIVSIVSRPNAGKSTILNAPTLPDAQVPPVGESVNRERIRIELPVPQSTPA